MHSRRAFVLTASVLPLAACTTAATVPVISTQATPDIAALTNAARDAEIAFAKTMADRDFEAFMSFIAEDAVFLNGGDLLVGKSAIGAFWKRFFEGEKAPFSWKPDLVAVNAEGDLAQTVGPVTDADGKLFMRFYSTWRLRNDRWQVVFDNGYSLACTK